jgi:hypothetical protein
MTSRKLSLASSLYVVGEGKSLPVLIDFVCIIAE